MNKVFTLHYFQPEAYHFSLDSVLMAQKIVEFYKNHPQISTLRFLDLCSGCGVIGLEIYFFLREIKCFDFVDVQEIYKEFFKKNLELFTPVPFFKFFPENYKNFSPPELYDVIVCNPPYFFPSEGQLSSNEFKNRCRFFLDSDFETLISSLCRLLKVQGCAYLLLQSKKDYGRDEISETTKLLPEGYSLEVLEKIRISTFVKIQKNF